MAHATVYPYGSIIRAVATFYASANPSGAAIQPASVFLLLRNPLGSIASWGFGAASVAGSPGIVRVATGAYFLDMRASVAGGWHYAWEAPIDADGALTARDEFAFVVERNRVL